MAIKYTKMHRFEPRFHHMKDGTCRFHVLKARPETMHFSTLSGHVSIRKNHKKIVVLFFPPPCPLFASFCSLLASFLDLIGLMLPLSYPTWTVIAV